MPDYVRIGCVKPATTLEEEVAIEFKLADRLPEGYVLRVTSCEGDGDIAFDSNCRPTMSYNPTEEEDLDLSMSIELLYDFGE